MWQSLSQPSPTPRNPFGTETTCGRFPLRFQSQSSRLAHGPLQGWAANSSIFFLQQTTFPPPTFCRRHFFFPSPQHPLAASLIYWRRGWNLRGCIPWFPLCYRLLKILTRDKWDLVSYLWGSGLLEGGTPWNFGVFHPLAVACQGHRVTPRGGNHLPHVL